MMSEISTDLGDKDVCTHPAVAPSPQSLLDNPIVAWDEHWIDMDRPRFWADTRMDSKLSQSQSVGRGYRWADGMPLYTGMNTILPPNREIVLQADRDDSSGGLTASSRHQGGAHVCLGDGAVRYISDSIDAGNSQAATVYLGSSSVPGMESPYGVWGAMGTRSSGELKSRSASIEDGQ